LRDAFTYLKNTASSLVLDSLKFEENGMVLHFESDTALVRDTVQFAGPELVTNGTFDTDTDWTKGTGWSISGGAAIAAGPASDGFYLEQSIGLTIGRRYVLTLTVSGTLGGVNYLAIRLGSTSDTQAITAAGTYEIEAVATADSFRIRSEASTSDITIDNVSIQLADNNYDGSFNTETADFLTYTSPSAKNVLHADGELKYAAHNLLTYSEDLTQWTNSGTTDSGQVLTATAGGVEHELYVITDTTANAPYRIKARFKAGTHDFVFLDIRGATLHYCAAVFDLSNGLVTETSVGSTSGTIISTSIVDAGGGYWDCELVGYTANTSSDYYFLGFAEAATGNTFNTSGRVTYSAAGTETIEVTRIQLSNYPAATTYLKTTGSARYALPIEYNSAGAGLGVLSEPAATNILLYQDLSNADYTTPNATIAAYTSTGAITDAYKITDDGTSGRHGLYKLNVWTAGVQHTLSVCFNCTASSIGYAALLAGASNTSEDKVIVVNLTTKAFEQDVTTLADIDAATIEVLDDDWIRVSVTTTDTNAGYDNFRVEMFSGANWTDGGYVGIGDTLVLAYPQVETGSVPTSYIPTYGSTVTRAADRLSLAPSAFPFSDTAGSFITKHTPKSSALSVIVDISSSNTQKLQCYSNNANHLYSYPGLLLVNLDAGDNSTVGTAFLTGTSWQANDYAAVIDGGTVATSTAAGALPTVTGMFIGADRDAAGPLNGHLNYIKYVNYAETDAELITETTA